MTPEGQGRAARRAFCLVEMDFGNGRLWLRRLASRTRPQTSPTIRDPFPRTQAIRLARGILTAAWYTVRADRATAAFVFGMHTEVADLLETLTLHDIEQIADLHFRQARPKWENHIGFWEQMLQAAESADLRRAREVNMRGLKLIASALLSAENS